MLNTNLSQPKNQISFKNIYSIQIPKKAFESTNLRKVELTFEDVVRQGRKNIGGFLKRWSAKFTSFLEQPTYTTICSEAKKRRLTMEEVKEKVGGYFLKPQDPEKHTFVLLTGKDKSKYVGGCYREFLLSLLDLVQKARNVEKSDEDLWLTVRLNEVFKGALWNTTHYREIQQIEVPDLATLEKIIPEQIQF